MEEGGRVVYSDYYNMIDVERLEDLIRAYDELPVLWNPNNPHYRNKKERNMALDSLMPMYVEVTGRTILRRDEFEKEIDSLRSAYRKEFENTSASESSQTRKRDEYQPTPVIYSLPLLNDEQPTNNPQIGQMPSVEDLIDVEMTPSPPSLQLSVSSPPTMATERSKMLALQTELLQKASSYLDGHIDWRNKISPAVILWSEKLMTLDPVEKRFAEKYINDVLFEGSIRALHRFSFLIYEYPSGYCFNPENLMNSQIDIQAIATLWGEKMDNLVPQQKLFAEKAINNILFEAAHGNLKRCLVNINKPLQVVLVPHSYGISSNFSSLVS